MRSRTRIACCAVIFLFLVPLVAGAQDEPTASLPLEEVLRLYKENEESQREEKVDPPFAATVNKMELFGRLLEGGIELQARFEVNVLAEGEWVSVPLMKRSATTTLSKLPAVNPAVLAIDGDWLSLVTKNSGLYSFEISLLEQAKAQGQRRTAVVDYQEATLARLLLQVDEGLFRLESTAMKQSDGIMIYPENGRFTVAWQRIAELPRARQETVQRPPIESVVRRAHGSVVSTLEGKAILRLLYELSFEGSRPIVFELPEGPSLERVYLNRVPIPFTAEAAKLELDVEPRRAGDQSGTVELVLESDQGGYNLSGDLLYELPRLSWPVNELYVDVHLPEVFNYTWTGGSLSPVEESPETVFAYGIPRPGKRLSFHQYLISKTSPTLRVDYAIDLTEKYFCDTTR